jgi:hypothetical protein
MEIKFVYSGKKVILEKWERRTEVSETVRSNLGGVKWCQATRLNLTWNLGWVCLDSNFPFKIKVTKDSITYGSYFSKKSALG